MAASTPTHTPIRETIGVTGDAVRPLSIAVPEPYLEDLRQRLTVTRWPPREAVADGSQGVRLERLRELVAYWRDGYDWRRAEAKLNALPQFVTQIDGLDIQFAHVRSPHPEAMPLVMTHGWPGSIFELLKVVGPLTDPTAHGGRAEDAFHLVLPSYPGYGFSGKPASPGWGPDRVARAWDELMWRLGYEDYVAQGGGWGAIVSQAMAAEPPSALRGIHVTMPAVVPEVVMAAIRSGAPMPAGLAAAERAAFDRLVDFHSRWSGYEAIMGTRPQTIAYALADSPAGQAAFSYDRLAAGAVSGDEPDSALSQEEMLDNITLYWLTNTAASSSQSFWEVSPSRPFDAVEIEIPVAVTVFPGENYQAPRSWAVRCYHDLRYWSEVDRGGHFAAWEEPELLVEEVRAAFRSQR